SQTKPDPRTSTKPIPLMLHPSSFFISRVAVQETYLKAVTAKQTQASRATAPVNPRKQPLAIAPLLSSFPLRFPPFGSLRLFLVNRPDLASFHTSFLAVVAGDHSTLGPQRF
ncbi:hypothetical protein HAX54_047665, partial [Datura stramonium]|nr:hypothetical protein [Datura stramonium]